MDRCYKSATYKRGVRIEINQLTPSVQFYLAYNYSSVKKTKFKMASFILVLLSIMLLNVDMFFSSPTLKQVDRALPSDKIPSEKGHMPMEDLESHDFLGSINGKYFYIERVNKTRLRGWDGCSKVYMILARFDTQEELDFVAATMTTSDGNAWTDGLNLQDNNGFRWGWFGNPPSEFTLEYKDKLAMTIGRRPPPEHSVLVAEFEGRERYTMCQYYY